MRRTLYVLAAPLLLAACEETDFDGVYEVDSYTLHEEGCDSPGTDVERTFETFEIRGRKYFGVDIWPVYPCDESGSCAADNDAAWSLVVEEKDLDEVGMTTTWFVDPDGCALNSEDIVIEGKDDGSVVLQKRQMQLITTPYKAKECTTDEAKKRRKDMHCETLIELVGTPAR